MFDILQNHFTYMNEIKKKENPFFLQKHVLIGKTPNDTGPVYIERWNVKYKVEYKV